VALEEGVRAVTLDEAVATASENSPTLEQARASVSSAEAQTTSALGRYLPNVNFSYGASKSSTGHIDATGQAITNQSYTSQLRSSLTLFDGFQRENNLTSARRETDVQRATYDQRRYEAVLSVKTAFFNAVAARDRVRVENARVARQEEQLRYVREQARLGQATRSDTLSSRVDLNNARLALLQAQTDRRSAEFALAQAMGITDRVQPAAEATLEPDTLGVGLDQLLSVATRHAPSVRSASLSVGAATGNVGSAKSSYWPSLSVSGGLDWRNQEFPPKARSWSFSFSGSVPIFNGLQRETSIDRAQAQVQIAQAQRRAAELAVRSNVQAAYDQIRTALAGMDLADETRVAAQEDLRVNEQRFRVGVATSVDLRAAQIALDQAEVDRIQRRFDYQVGVARLESLLGMPLEQMRTATANDETNVNGGIR